MRATAQVWLKQEEMRLRRWFARTYRQPPNSPLFEAETIAYWMGQVVADNMEEAEQLQALLAKAPPAGNPQAQAWRTRVEARLRELGGMVDSTADDQLAVDLAATERGELPEFLRRRMQRPLPEDAGHG